MLNITTDELWPYEVRKILKAKDIDEKTLKEEFEEVYFPWDSEYNTKRNYYTMRIMSRPLFIVIPHSVKEIEKILDYVYIKSLIPRVANGKHSSALVTEEVLILTSAFTHKELREDLLLAGTGNTQGMLNNFLFEVNNKCIYSHFGALSHPRVDTEAFPGGSAATVGSGGISTVGGIGPLARTYGLTIDSVLSYLITLPPDKNIPSRTVKADKDNYSDLYWALRGGMGSNFGIISEICYKILEVPPIILYSMTWEWKDAAKILKKWSKGSYKKEDCFNEDIILYYTGEEKEGKNGEKNGKNGEKNGKNGEKNGKNGEKNGEKEGKNGKLGIELSGIYVSKRGEDYNKSKLSIEKSLKCLKTKTSKLYISSEEKEYSDIYKSFVKNRPYFNFSVIQPIFTNKIDIYDVIRNMEKTKELELKGPVSIGFTLLGGKIDDVSSKDTAYYPRKYKFFMDIASFWQNFQDSYIIDEWTSDVIKTQMEIEENIVYVGFPLNYNIPHSKTIYNGKNTDKLRHIADKYDPLKILRPCGTLNQ